MRRAIDQPNPLPVLSAADDAEESFAQALPCRRPIMPGPLSSSDRRTPLPGRSDTATSRVAPDGL